MELKAYGEVIRRRWRWLALITLATLAISAVLALRGPTAYTATMRLAISVVPDARVGDFFKYDSYYSILSSEYLADDLSEVIKSEAFAVDVSEVLGYEVDTTEIVELTRIRKTHRLLDVMVSGRDREETLRIAEAFEEVLKTKLPDYFAFLQANNGQVRIINRPVVKRTSSLGLVASDLVVRTVAAMFVALGLIFLLDYLDDRIRNRRQVESLLGAPVLGEIPAA